jgi:hypothetical protein
MMRVVHPGSRGKKGTGSRIRNSVWHQQPVREKIILKQIMVTANSPTKFRKVGDSQDKGGHNRTRTVTWSTLSPHSLSQWVCGSLLCDRIRTFFRWIRIWKNPFGSGSEQLPIRNEFEKKNLLLQAGKIHDFSTKCTVKMFKIKHSLEGIVRTFEFGGVTILIISGLINWRPGNFFNKTNGQIPEEDLPRMVKFRLRTCRNLKRGFDETSSLKPSSGDKRFRLVVSRD